MQTRKMRSGREPPSKLTAGHEAPTAGHGAQGADQAVALLYQMHYRSLVRLAALLVADLATAEEIAQDSFAAVHRKWHALPDTDAALTYLRKSVVRRCRSAARLPPARSVPGGSRPPSGDSGQGTGPPFPGSAVMSALQALPARQREVMVLRYFAGLPEAEIAAATGMSPDAVRSALTRAMSSLHAGLRRAGELLSSVLRGHARTGPYRSSSRTRADSRR